MGPDADRPIISGDNGATTVIYRAWKALVSTTRGLVGSFALFILVVAVAAGPLGVASQDTQSPDSASVTLESAPTDTITLERGRFGSGRYHIEAPPAVVTVSDVDGTPTLRYVVDIPDAWLTVASRYELDGREGRLRMGVSPTTVSPDRIDQDSYDAIIAVWLRTGDRGRDLLQRRVTVEVRP